MSEETKTELKLPTWYQRPPVEEFGGDEAALLNFEQEVASKYAAFIASPTTTLPKGYRRPSLEEFRRSGYSAGYAEFFKEYELELAERYACGMRGAADFADIDDEMTDADGDGLPDVLHVKSQVRAVANRTLRARHPTRHRFKQYLFGNPSLRLVRKRVLRLSAVQVRAGLDELLEKEAAGILSVHTPNGQRVDLRALKDGRVELTPVVAAPPLPNPPLDSAANDIPAGENLPQFPGGTFPNDPATEAVLDRIVAEKQDEAVKKGAEAAPAVGDPADPADATDPVDPVAPAASTELEQPPMGVDGNTAPIVNQLPQDSDASVEASAADPALAATEVAPVIEETQEETSKSSGKHGKKGGKR